jgi:uncharacterized protein (UPF0332 family)
MITDNDRNELILYRLNQAQETMFEVEKLIEATLFKVAVNRIYYGIFYCLTALALKYEFKSSKHLQLIGWFNQNFIKTSLIDIRYGKILKDAFETRTEGDYLPYIEFEKPDAIIMYEGMKDFIQHLTAFIKKD